MEKERKMQQEKILQEMQEDLRQMLNDFGKEEQSERKPKSTAGQLTIDCLHL